MRINRINRIYKILFKNCFINICSKSQYCFLGIQSYHHQNLRNGHLIFKEFWGRLKSKEIFEIPGNLCDSRESLRFQGIFEIPGNLWDPKESVRFYDSIRLEGIFEIPNLIYRNCGDTLLKSCLIQESGYQYLPSKLSRSKIGKSKIRKLKIRKNWKIGNFQKIEKFQNLVQTMGLTSARRVSRLPQAILRRVILELIILP